MTTRRGHACVGGLLSLLCASGCARANEVSAGIERAQRSLDQVLGAGGYVCAPRELALARAQLEFARTDLSQGEPLRAEDHLEQATLNASAAARLSPPERCASSGSVVREIPHTEEPDRDHDGVPDTSDGCADEAEDLDGFQDADGCPDPDNDLDGIPDALDHCPRQAEDRDGYQDADGCPDPDNDQDGVADTLDRCPLEPGPPASEGCPRLRYKGVEVTASALRLLEPVVFENEAAAIRSVSFPLLDTVVLALNEHPTMTIEVQGHTESRGDDDANMKLSQARAEAVVAYLAGHGIDRSRLTAAGYGETRPIESNRTSQGRDVNRRVELVRTDKAR